MPFAVERVLAGLTGSRLRGPVHHLASTSSTNDDVRALARAGAVEGTVVVADHQTSGRGRHGRTWQSAAGQGLLLSVLLRPRSLPSAPQLLVNMAGVAVAEALRELTGADARTKWPNDILIGGRKVGGVLVQAGLPEHAVIGIGVNVLGDRECLPADFREGATTLLSETGQAWPREDSLAAVLNQLDTYYGLWLSGASGGIVARQRELEVTIGQVVCVLTPQGQHQGQVLDIADSGGLVVSTPDGPRELLVGEVTSVRPSSPEP